MEHGKMCMEAVHNDKNKFRFLPSREFKFSKNMRWRQQKKKSEVSVIWSRGTLPVSCMQEHLTLLFWTDYNGSRRERWERERWNDVQRTPWPKSIKLYFSGEVYCKEQGRTRSIYVQQHQYIRRRFYTSILNHDIIVTSYLMYLYNERYKPGQTRR